MTCVKSEECAKQVVSGEAEMAYLHANDIVRNGTHRRDPVKLNIELNGCTFRMSLISMEIRYHID